ncbi:uncharacterized protein LOC115131005 isoform X2 [Oncorhynchus nerka]|uniref:uncharacterized protein LOC115131005 isoform X2 n=1 Tax=Oncorhynchus nerka TaxID=8023 RepID=UPI001130FBD0|nr:uncharacterized protein LOC115131005 isoform X2 [Oncorhynchus nerka]
MATLLSWDLVSVVITLFLVYTDNAEHGLQMLLVFTIPSAIGGVALCIGICCMVWLCRKIKKEQTSHCERRGEESNAPSQGHTARREQRQRSQYFERFNSVYGHY